MKPSIWMICAALVASAAGPVWAQPPEAPKELPGSDKNRTGWLHETYLKDVSAYTFFLDPAMRQKLELRREPVMRWTSSGDFNGEVYVWTHEGAAAIAGCVFSGPQGKSGRRILHEFHSLAPHPLYASERGGSGWLPQEAGITLKPVADAPEPARNPALRLAQMRDLARRFSAQVERENSKWEMRLLPQPVYRYEIADGNSPVVDGAVFVFVWTAGTDPEVLLVIEARRIDQRVQWHYAPARFTNREVWLKYQDQPVWHAESATVGIFDGVTTMGYGAFAVKTIANPEEKP